MKLLKKQFKNSRITSRNFPKIWFFKMTGPQSLKYFCLLCNMLFIGFNLQRKMVANILNMSCANLKTINRFFIVAFYAISGPMTIKNRFLNPMWQDLSMVMCFSLTVSQLLNNQEVIFSVKEENDTVGLIYNSCQSRRHSIQAVTYSRNHFCYGACRTVS